MSFYDHKMGAFKQRKSFIYSFIFIPPFPLGRVRDVAAEDIERLEIPHRFQQFPIVVEIPHQDWTKQCPR